ncbi:MAG TPA: Hint domain-containing protein [Polyangia bacterium]|nr:Hint domain-containing protein [Polyangia bacterium]
MKRALFLLLCACAGCDVGDTFHCTATAQCMNGGQHGFCEITGYCSFVDTHCAGGRRYGQFAGDSLAGACVGSTDLASGGVDLTSADLAGVSVDLAGVDFAGDDLAMPLDMISSASDLAVVSPFDMSTCFAAGSPVTLADGTARPIEQLRPGDRVLSYDVRTHRLAASRVLRVVAHEVSAPILWLDGRVAVTPNHPLFLDGAWLPAGQARAGSRVLALERADCARDCGVRPAELAWVATSGRASIVYDVELEAGRNFFVGSVLFGLKTM